VSERVCFLVSRLSSFSRLPLGFVQPGPWFLEADAAKLIGRFGLHDSGFDPLFLWKHTPASRERDTRMFPMVYDMDPSNYLEIRI